MFCFDFIGKFLQVFGRYPVFSRTGKYELDVMSLLRLLLGPLTGTGPGISFRHEGNLISVRKYKLIAKCQGKKITNRDPVGYDLCRVFPETYDLCLGSSETLSFLRPFFLLPESMERPEGEDILSLKPCLFFLFLLDG